MQQLSGPPAEVRLTVTITRAETGKQERFDMVGYADPERLEQFLKEQEHGSHTQHSST